MTQPTFVDGPPVPLMVEGFVDAATLRQLFADYSTSAEIIGIREKGDLRVYADAVGITADTAFDRLLKAATRAVQVRYRHDGFEWTDTILAASAGFRVIRCRHET